MFQISWSRLFRLLDAILSAQPLPRTPTNLSCSTMPSAVVTTVLATEYDVEPDFVTAVVFTSTWRAR